MEILTSNLYNVYSMAMARFDTRLSDKILRAGKYLGKTQKKRKKCFQKKPTVYCLGLGLKLV